MVYTLLFAAAFAAAFFLIGAPWILRFKALQTGPVVLVSMLLGLAASLTTSSIVLLTGATATFITPVLAAIALTGWIVYYLKARGIQLPKQKLATAKRLSIPALILSVPALAYSWLASTGFVSTGLAFRIGPDNFGWAIASKVLCLGDTPASLSHRVQQQLGPQPLLSSLDHPLADASFKSITQIPSFTDQAAFEFIVGAHRTGAPGFLGGLCAVGAEPMFANVFLGLVVLAIFMLSLVFYSVARLHGIKRWFAASISAVLTGSFAVFSVGLEGGFGQLLTLPIFAWALSAVLAKTPSAKNIVVSFTALIAAAFATYIDVLFFAGPFLFLLVIARTLLGHFKWSMPNLKSALASFALLVVAVIPLAQDFWRLAIFPLLHPSAGGWDQGKFAFTSNIFGLSNWLPEGWYVVIPRDDLKLWLDLVLTGVLLTAVLVSGIRKNLGFVLAVLSSLYLTYSVYAHYDTIYGWNNYRLWKFGPYAVVALSFLLWNLFEKRSAGVRSVVEKPRVSTYLQRVLGSVVLLSTLTMSIIWSLDWNKSRRVFMTEEATPAILALEEKYDLIVDGSDGVLMPLEWAFKGNLHYALSSRGWGLAVSRSVPARPLVVVRSLGNPCDMTCATEVAGPTAIAVTPLGDTKWFSTYLITTQ